MNRSATGLRVRRQPDRVTLMLASFTLMLANACTFD
jgi:hypothetical protein